MNLGTEICETCGTLGRPVERMKGSAAVELVLWLMLLLPGLIYSMWRVSSKEPVCPGCGGKMISIHTPRGQHIWRTLNQSRLTE